jgi:acetyl esterase/lipase
MPSIDRRSRARVLGSSIAFCGALCVSLTALPWQTEAPPTFMRPADLGKLPMPPADHRLAYGDDPNQIGELRLPPHPGPHPVVVLVHGGCWKAEAGRYLAAMGDTLKSDGIASWSIEYRRLGQPGGGWPGTYLDVGHAIDRLRELAAPYKLDLNRVVVLVFPRS